MTPRLDLCRFSTADPLNTALGAGKIGDRYVDVEERRRAACQSAPRMNRAH